MSSRNKRFHMDGYCGGVIDSAFFGRLVIDITGIETTTPLPALREHDRLRPVGVIDKTAKAESKLVAFGYFLNDSRDAIEIQSQLDQSFPVQASVGIWLDEVEVLEKGESAIVNGREFSDGVIVRK